MSRFTNILVVSPLPDGRRWVVREPLVYEVGRLGSGDEVVVPAGFVTDFASVPRWVWWMYPPWGRYGNAAVLHDWMYWDQSRTRPLADAFFLEAMAALKVPRRTRNTIYVSVLFGGWWAWRANAKLKTVGPGKICQPLPNRYDGTYRKDHAA